MHPKIDTATKHTTPSTNGLKWLVLVMIGITLVGAGWYGFNLYQEFHQESKGITVHLSSTSPAEHETHGYWLFERPPQPYDKFFHKFVEGFESWSRDALSEPDITFQLSLNDFHEVHDEPCITASIKLDSTNFHFDVKSYYHEVFDNDLSVVDELTDATQHSALVLISMLQLKRASETLLEQSFKHRNETRKM